MSAGHPRSIAYLSYSPARYDSRTQRMARSAEASGYRVTVYARLDPGYPAVEVIGDRLVRRVPADLSLLVPWRRAAARARIAGLHRDAGRAAASGTSVPKGGEVDPRALPAPARRSRLAAMEDRLRDTVVGDPLRSLKQAIVGPIRRLLMFPLRPIAWGMAIAAIAEPADVWHGMWAGSLPGILHLRSRLGGVAVYDSRDIYLHARYFDRMSRPWRAIFRRIERHWARRCDAVITVNQAYADILVRTLGIAPPAIVMNCPDRFDPPEPRPDRIRAELGLGPDRAVVLYQGNLMTERGIEQGMDAILEVPGADLVLLGYGGLKPVLAGQVAGPPFLGRVHLLEAVPPSELLDWTCSADVMLMAIQPTTINHRYTTPNKLWEAMAAGIPVVASDLPGMAAIVRETGCGVLCDPTSPADIARAIRSILELPAEGRVAIRAAALAAAHDRYNWARQATTLLAVYARLTDRPDTLRRVTSTGEGS